MKYPKLAILLFMAVLLMNGCSGSEIQGTVKDAFGNNMEGVEVSIEKSDLKSFTGKDGSYTIPYVLGTFIVKYSKPGYTTQKITLTITEKTHFPAQTVTLYPIPKEPGLYLIREKDLIKMSPGKIVMQNMRKKSGDGLTNPLRRNDSLVNFYPDKVTDSPMRPGKSQFIDKSSLQLIPMRLRSDGCFLELVSQYHGLEFKVAYDGSIKEEKTKTGEENLLVRTINCEPGSYAWVALSDDMFGRMLPKPKGTCYAFTVKSEGVEQSQETNKAAQAISDVVKKVEEQEATKQLFKAIETGDSGMAENLLRQGADPNSIDERGNTPLIQAVSRKLTSLAKILLDKGANPDLRNDNEPTPLIIATRNGNEEIVSLLLDKGADPNLREGTFGMTALMLAANQGHNNIVNLLINKRANPNIQNNNGDTALMLIAPKGWANTVKILAEAGTDLTIRNNRGFDAAKLAERESHFNISQMLRAPQSQGGSTARDYQFPPGASSTSSNKSPKWPWTSQRTVEDSDLRGLSPKELELMRNEIYARHGWIFNRSDLQQYFNSQSWYKPKGSPANSEQANRIAVAEINPIEKKNIQVIKEYEKRKSSSPPAIAQKVKLKIEEEAGESGGFSGQLVGGKPSPIQVSEITYERNLDFGKPWRNKYPKADHFGRQSFKQETNLSVGGQRFIFQYLVQDGSRAGEPLGSAYVAYDFDASGRFLGTKILRYSEELECR